MEKKYYVQCKMKKKVGEDSYKTDVAWIPEKFAKLNKWIKIKQPDGSWDDQWQVVFIGTKRKSKEVEAKERDFLKTRKASDV